MESIIFKPANIVEFLRLKIAFTFSSVCFVVNEFSIIERPIIKDINTLPMCFAV